tara:strand:- start:19016 stop:19174 length:159 start_codon:yes stop_codon:yes gene_type:complete
MKEFVNQKFDARFAISRSFPTDFVNNGRFMMFLWNDGDRPIKLFIDERKTEA